MEEASGTGQKGAEGGIDTQKQRLSKEKKKKKHKKGLGAGRVTGKEGTGIREGHRGRRDTGEEENLLNSPVHT